MSWIDFLLIAVSYMFYFIKKCLKKTMTEIRTDCITSDTITFTKYRLLQLAQMTDFPDEYRAFESNVPISKKADY